MRLSGFCDHTPKSINNERLRIIIFLASRGTRMQLFSVSLLIGCWKESSELPQVDTNKIPFENSELQQESVYISVLDSNLTCPDGQQAPIFVVYPETEEPLSVAVIFHSNPVAFISNFEQSNAQLPDRLSAQWVENKLWETLGLSKNPQDLYEKNQGFLAVALAEAGFIQIYPGNCWGDYWHSDPNTFPNAESLSITVNQEDTANPTQPEFGEFTRYGRTQAVQVIDALSDTVLAEEIGLNFLRNIQLNSADQHWIGLGEGGRAILELLSDGATNTMPTSVFLDSVPLNLQPYMESPQAFPLEYGTISNVFIDESGAPISDLTSFSWSTVTFPSRVALLWSNGDSKMPHATIEGAVQNLSAAELWQEDQNQSGHIFINRDIDLARRAVQFMKTGNFVVPEEPTEEPVPEPTQEPAPEPSTNPEDTASQ